MRLIGSFSQIAVRCAYGRGRTPNGVAEQFPELVTERLRLRAPSPRDATAVLAVVGDPEVTRYHSVPTLTTLAEAHAALERLEQRYAARDAIRWAIELVEAGGSRPK